MVRRAWLAALLLATAAPAVLAQEGTLKIIVGSAAGTTLDALARIVAEKMGQKLGQAVVVDNRPGAGGAVAAVAVKSAGPQSGALFMVAMGTMVGLPHSAPNVPFHPIRDFAPVAQLAEFDNVFCVNAAVPATSVSDYAKLVKQDGRYGNYASSGGAGAPPYYLAELVARQEGLKLTNVSYRATGPLLLALGAGEISAAMVPANDVKPLVRAGKVRLLATTAARRLPAYPALPTLKELGYPVESTQWYGLFAPVGTDKGRIEAWSRAASEAMQQADVRERLVNLGMEPAPGDAAAMQARLGTDFENWGRIIRGIGIPANR